MLNKQLEKIINIIFFLGAENGFLGRRGGK